MRKIVAVEQVSLDGVFESPEEWAFAYSNDEMEQVNAAGMSESDALLIGRKTYEVLAAFWPNQPGGSPVVDYINSVAKFVVSTTLQSAKWNNSTIINANVEKEITDLKQHLGKNITVIGSGVLVRSLLQHGLLDELSLMMIPVVRGSGKRLFEDGIDATTLELVNSRTFGTGVVNLSYRLLSEP